MDKLDDSFTDDVVDGEQLTCSGCSEPVVESAEFCTNCGVKVVEEISLLHCACCGLDTPVQESAYEDCPRCHTPYVFEAEDSNVADEEDDDEDDDDSDDSDDDDSVKTMTGKKKTLQDKKKEKKESTRYNVKLSAVQEADLLVHMARLLGEDAIPELAAQLVWGSIHENLDLEKAVIPPGWVPDHLHAEWAKTISVGRPKTMLAAIHVLGQGLVR